LKSSVGKVGAEKVGISRPEEDSSSIYKQLWGLEGEADKDKRRTRVGKRVAIPSLPPPAPPLLRPREEEEQMEGGVGEA
jgi:hypothetical protein